MFKTKRNIVLALALCALLLPMTLTAKDKVERPFKFHAENLVILDLSRIFIDPETGHPMAPFGLEWEYGEATHLGRYTSTLLGEGTIDLVTYDLYGSGYLTAANGDQLFYELGPGGGYTGGTGRFEGASGSGILTFTTESSEPDPEFPWLLRVRNSLSLIGTLTY